MNLILPSEKMKQLQAFADRNGTTVPELVHSIVIEWIDKQKNRDQFHSIIHEVEQSRPYGTNRKRKPVDLPDFHVT